jgi:uncharacterized protein (DUF4415 family)
MKKRAGGKRRKTSGRKALRGRKIGGLRAQADEMPDPGMYRPLKMPVTLRLDADVLAWFKAQGRGYQTRINSALRGVMMREKKA